MRLKSMAESILFVFEGEKTEGQLLHSFKKHCLDLSGCEVVSCFASDIYALYHEIKDDEYLTLFGLLKEKEILPEGIHESDQISEIYLFFDHDGHDPAAGSQKIEELLSLFDDSTGHGSLFISYPMIEAHKHLKNEVDFGHVCAKIEANKKYKKSVSQESEHHYQNLFKLSEENWRFIVQQHCCKANLLVHGKFSMPDQLIDQKVIFQNQKNKHLNLPEREVSVLGSFPLFLLDRKGVIALKEMVSNKIKPEV